MTVSEETQLFIEDALERLDEADRAVLAIDEALVNQAEIPAGPINALFRCVHTIKGNAGIMGYEGAIAVAHALEWGLDRVRAGELALDRPIVNDIFAGLDALRTIVGALAEGEDLGFDWDEVAAGIEASFRVTDPAPVAGPTLAERFPGWSLPGEGEQADAVRRMAAGQDHLYRLRWTGAAPAGEATFEQLRALGVFVAWREAGEPGAWEAAWLSPAEDAVVTPFVGMSAAVHEPWAIAAPAPAPAPPAAEPEAPPAPALSEPAETSIRVGISLLDTLMNLVGELVLTRNQVLQHLRGNDDPTLGTPVQRLNLITTELQEAVMRTRMQPVGQVWERFPRLIRDYCQASGKRVQLIMEGAETELDKSLLEGIKDPLTHLVRNAIDHGIEPPEARVARGKPERATVTLLAYQDGGQIIMEVRDDGRGLDYGRIREKARTQGLATADALARMSEAELVQLIFLPGFSTAEAVTAVSGRGVGMDVVRANIERIGGTVDLASTPGRGTTFRLRIPLTLAVIPALIIHAGAERFAVPQSAVLEVVRAGEGLQRIEKIRGSQVYRLRDTLIPVVALRTALGLERADGEVAGDYSQLVVIQSGDQVIGLAVDEIGDTEEIVVKSLHRFMQALPTYSGVTIMGDGRACLILDVAGLAAPSGRPKARGLVPEAAAAADGPPGEKLLLCRIADRTYAVPMARVARLEEFAAKRIERVGDRLVVQYGSGLLPLVAPEPFLGLPPEPAANPASVVVIGEGPRAVGIRVSRIVDIVDDVASFHPVACIPGVTGAAIIDGATVEVLDVAALIPATPTLEAAR